MPEPAGAVKKASGATGGGAVAIVVCWALGEFAAVAVPNEVAIALSTIFGLVGNWLVKRWG